MAVERSNMLSLRTGFNVLSIEMGMMNNIVIRLPVSFNKCPIYWRNFIHYCQRNRQDWRFSSDFIINNHLQKHDATFTYLSDGSGELEFETEADHIIFLLKWT